MPNPQDIFQLAQQTATQVTASPENWRRFLYTAAHNYHTTYLNQLLIHAQRPDATACADFDIWNNRMNRYVPRSAIPPPAGKRGLNMNFNHEELMLMMLYNTGTRLGLIHELRLMQCYLMPDETALRELSEGVIEKLKLLTDAEFAELEFPPD